MRAEDCLTIKLRRRHCGIRSDNSTPALAANFPSGRNDRHLMTANKRIFLNIVATYGRSLYALVIGLFCGRWMLMALGKSDYGLLGVVGGLAFFISYLNSILAGSFGRFFAISVGERKADEATGIENGRMWFTTAMAIQSVIPTLLIVLLYPIGEWAVRDFLTIPPDKIEACIWVWRFVCFSCYIGMVTIPLNAMYAAHQYIAELTIYSFATSTANAFFLYYMVTHPGNWLSRMALWQCLVSVLPNVIIAIRAFYLFPECRLVKRHLRCWGNVKKLSAYAFWNAWGAFGATLREQGMAILINKYFGLVVNAGIAIGSTISAHCNTLSGSLQGAFSPAIYNAWGEKDYDLARRFAFLTCKFGTLFILVFAIPLALEVDEVLLLWLKDPPQWAAEMCIFVLLTMVVDRLSSGHLICVCAKGKIAMYQAVLGTFVVLTLPIAWLLIIAGVNVWSVGISMVTTTIACSLGRVWFARSLVGMSARYWLKNVFTPIVITALICIALGYVPIIFMKASFIRVCCTTLLSEMVLLGLSWGVLLNRDEREFLTARIAKWRNRHGNS